MKIKFQKNLKSNPLDMENIRRSWRAKSFFMFFITAIVCAALSLMLIFYGAVLQKNQTMASIQQIVFNAAETKLSVFSNYVSGLLSSPDRIYIDIDFKGIQSLNFARDVALEKGRITDREQEITVKGNFSVGSKKYKVKVSPTGLNLDMIGDIDKRAYKIKVLEGEKIYGMKEFKLIPAYSRHNVVEWVGHALEKREGLIALRYFFVVASLNGKDLGVYALEEHLNKELLENNKAREGIIFKLKENQVRIFNEKRTNKDANKRHQIRLLRSALQSLKNHEIEIDRIFDLKKWATYFSIIDLMNGYHAANSMNAIFYFNPVTNLIEPITREYNSLRYSDGPPKDRLFIADSGLKGLGDSFIGKLFQNEEFIVQYLAQLMKLSKKNYLDEFFEIINKDLNIQKNIIFRDDPFYKFPKEYMYIRQQHIRNWLNKDLNVVANIDEDNPGLYAIKVKNNSIAPVKLISFFSSDKEFISVLNQVILPGETIFKSIELVPNVRSEDLNFSYKIDGIKNVIRESIVVPKSFSSGISLSKLWNESSDDFLKSIGIIVNRAEMKVLFVDNDTIISRDVFIPEGFIVEGQPGLTINLLDGASVYSKSAFKFNGETNSPIKITSSDRKGGGIIIFSPKEDSMFVDTIFEHLASPNIGSSGLTASVTIYDANVTFQKCIFEKNESEDILNLIHSKYEIGDSQFRYVKSDAVDSDYSKGSIINSTFTNIGNDALDFSGSISTLSNIIIDGVGDKALSAGEISKISGRYIEILNAEIGITSKDLSEVNLSEVEIRDSRLGFAIFQKKEEYGAAKAIVEGLEMTNVDFDHLVGFDSTLTLNGKNVINKRSEISDLLYGATFGKSSL